MACDVFPTYSRLDASADVLQTYPEKKKVGVGRTAEGPAPGYGERVSKALMIC